MSWFEGLTHNLSESFCIAIILLALYDTTFIVSCCLKSGSSVEAWHNGGNILSLWCIKCRGAGSVVFKVNQHSLRLLTDCLPPSIFISFGPQRHIYGLPYFLRLNTSGDMLFSSPSFLTTVLTLVSYVTAAPTQTSSPLEERGSSVIIGYRTVSSVCGPSGSS